MAVMQNLNHLTFAFGMLGNLISGLVFLAPIPTFYRIYKKKSTEGFSSLPYLVALFSSTLWLYYALILKKDTIPLITINSAGCFIESIYVTTFIIYATRNARILAVKHFMALNVASFVIILVTIQIVLHDSLRVQVLGWICTVFSICVFVAPLSIMREVYRTKSVKYMPFNLSLFLTLSAIVWFAYGFSLGEINIYLPNVVGVILGMLQMILYGIYRNGEVENKEVKNKEVHPIAVEDHHVNIEIEIGKEGAEEEISVVAEG